MTRINLRPAYLAGVAVALFSGIAPYLRIDLRYDFVFTDSWIKFAYSDAFYHMRIVDNLIYNFPRLYSFDPYFIYPDGYNLNGIQFFNSLLAGIIWLIVLGSPTQQTIDIVGVLFPPFLAVLTIITVYFIGKSFSTVGSVFYPEYYQLMTTRFYNFNGARVTPENSTVISYQGKVSSSGTAYNEIVDQLEFPNYQKAIDYIVS